MGANSLRCVAFAYCSFDIEKIPMEDITSWELPEDDLTLLGIIGIKVAYCYCGLVFLLTVCARHILGTNTQVICSNT
jgi:hypothetical protein